MKFDFLEELDKSFGNESKKGFDPEVAQASRGERNNNPGNLEDGEFTRKMPGYKGSDGRFAIFATPQDGHRAQETLLREGRRYRGKTPAQIIHTYAPPGDNSTESIRNYIGYASRRAGVDPDKPIPPDKIPAFAAGMREFETGKTQKIGFTPYGGSVSQGASGGANALQFLEGIESAAGTETASSQNVRQNSKAIFGSDEEMATRANNVEAAIQQQGTGIEVLDQALGVSQAAAIEAMTRQVQDTRTISEEIVKGTQELKAKVTPIFAARGRVADQLDKLATMNPLEKGLRGIFDLNYSEEYLTGQLDRFDRTLKMRAEDYQYLGDLHNVALNEIERRYTLDTAVPSLLAKQAEEDLGIVGMRISQTSGMLGSLKDKISGESMLIQAKEQARGDLLGRLDTPTTVDLMTKAQANGGVVEFNGVEFSYGELRDQVQRSEQQEMQMRSYALAVKGNEIDLADKIATNIARNLTREQVETAMANGGVHNGIQLPNDVLAQVQQNYIATGEQQARSIATKMPASLALSTAADSLTQATQLYRRTSGLFGKEATADSAPYLDRGTQLIRELTQRAADPNTPPEVLVGLTQQIAANSASYAKKIDETLLRTVGGDKKAAGFLKSFVYGSPIGQGTAVEALSYFALKGNLPQGIQLSPEAKQVFAKAQQVVEANRNHPTTGKARSAAELTTIVTREMQAKAPGMVGQARFGRFWNDLPGVAQRTGHQFGKLDQKQWKQTLANAQMDAAKALAPTLNTTPQNVIQMSVTRKALSNKPEDVTLFEEFNKASGKFNAAEQASLVDQIDRMPQIQAGRRNSTILADFLGSPSVMNAADTYTGAVGSQSLGDFLINPLSQGSLQTQISQTRDALLTTQADASHSARQAARNQPYGMMTQPVLRANVIMASIDGVGTEGAKALTPTVRNIIEEYRAGEGWAKGMDRPLSVSPNAIMIHEDTVVYNRLASIKFQDPRLETYRKSVVRGWQDNATRTMGTLERVAEFTGQVIDAANPFNMSGN